VAQFGNKIIKHCKYDYKHLLLKTNKFNLKQLVSFCHSLFLQNNSNLIRYKVTTFSIKPNSNNILGVTFL